MVGREARRREEMTLHAAGGVVAPCKGAERQRGVGDTPVKIRTPSCCQLKFLAH